MYKLKMHESQMTFDEMDTLVPSPNDTIRYPKNKPFIVCIDAPGLYYDDDRDWQHYQFVGAGLIGDQQMISNGNIQLRDHQKDGKDVLMFKKLSDGYGFLGVYRYHAHHSKELCMKDPERSVIAFQLDRIADAYHYNPVKNIGKAMTLDEIYELEDPKKFTVWSAMNFIHSYMRDVDHIYEGPIEYESGFGDDDRITNTTQINTTFTVIPRLKIKVYEADYFAHDLDGNFLDVLGGELFFDMYSNKEVLESLAKLPQYPEEPRVDVEVCLNRYSKKEGVVERDVGQLEAFVFDPETGRLCSHHQGRKLLSIDEPPPNIILEHPVAES